MSEKPKFEVIDRRKMKAEEEQHAPKPATEPEKAPEKKPESAGPRLVTSEPATTAGDGETAGMPEPPTAEESREQKSAYDASSERLDDLIRAQNPGVEKQPPITFESLLQQLYLSAMVQMGAGTPEGQRPRIDILWARQTIDLLGVLAEKTRGNLSVAEEKALQMVLFEARMAFLELTKMITIQPPPPPPAEKK